MESQDWIVDGQKLVSVKKGNGEKLIILLPGYSLAGNWAIERYEGLWDNATIYALNFPGFHGSDLIEEKLSIVLIYKWVLKVMEVMNVTTIHLTAHSFGGRIALLFAKEYPELIDKLTLIAPVIRVNDLEKWSHFLPVSIQHYFLNYFLKDSRLFHISKRLNRAGLLHKADLKFLEMQNQNAESIERMYYYARSIPDLYVSEQTIKQVFSNNIHIDLFLSKKDPHCDYRFWLGITQDYSNVKVNELKGGHFGRIG